MKTLRRLILPLAVVAVTVAAPVSGAASPRSITVNGTGVVKTTPTAADFTFGVAANGQTTSVALAANAAKMNNVISALKNGGVAAGDIQTAQISLQPNTDQTGAKILNYTATNQVAAHVRNIGKAGPLIDAAVRAGANQISGPSLSSADELALSRNALKAAIGDARARAQTIATAAGVRLGAVLTVSESSTSSPVPLAAVAQAKAASTPVSAGTVAIEADVTVTYAIG